MMKMVAALLAVGTIMVCGAGCSSTVDNTGSGQQAGSGATGDPNNPNNPNKGATGGGTGQTPDPSTGKAANAQQEAAINASTVYVAETDPTKANEIVVRMWTLLTSNGGCWYMRGSSDNYLFYGYNNYRYSGYETTAGTVGNISAGKYGPYDAAQVMISSREHYVGIYDDNNMAIAQQHFNGEWFMNWYERKAQCV
jgi:hypothetical protein